MKSLRARIFALVAGVTLLVWTSAAAWTFFNTRADVRRVLDRRLVEAANMVSSLVGDLDTSGAVRSPALSPAGSSYSRQLSCQIWSLDGRLIGRSSEAPAAPLTTEASGFSERNIDGERWRVYSLADPRRGIRVLVGDNLSVRKRLIADLMTGLLLPSLLGIIGLALLIWAAVGKGLSPLREVAHKLRHRDPSDLAPLGVMEPSTELQPVIRSIEGLFERLEHLRSNERHFIASAAHELQTPLAGLRTHAQIALLTEEASVRENSLRMMQRSVDRTSRLVRQLLDLATEEAATERPTRAWLPLDAAARTIQEELGPRLRQSEVRLTLTPSATRSEFFIDEGSLVLALRNLVENAMNHSPPGSEVKVDVIEQANIVALSVCDQGPGIPTSEIERVKDRFVRGSREKSPGSGLGLSIVELAIVRSDGRLELQNIPGGGLRASVIIPGSYARLNAVAKDAQPISST